MLAAFEPCGRLDDPKLLQELIAYAADNKKIQCAAWLPEYSQKKGVKMKNGDLGCACRFGTLEEVKSLVERGANFKNPNEPANPPVDRIDRGDGLDFSVLLIDKMPTVVFWSLKDGNLSPVEERLKITKYLLGISEKVGLRPERLLYFSMVHGCEWLFELLKKRGFSLPKDVKINYVRFFLCDSCPIDGMRLALREIELELFDKYTRKKTKLLRYFIDNDAADLLAAFEPLGWFKQPSRLRELISYAADNKKIQCAAWLLNYSERARK